MFYLEKLASSCDLDVFCVINCAALLAVIIRGLFVAEGRFTFYILGSEKVKEADIFMYL